MYAFSLAGPEFDSQIPQGLGSGPTNKATRSEEGCMFYQDVGHEKDENNVCVVSFAETIFHSLWVFVAAQCMGNTSPTFRRIAGVLSPPK